MPMWCKQFPKNSTIHDDFDIRSLKEKYEPDHQLRYCPDMAAPSKAGRPKNQKRMKSPLEGNRRKMVKASIDTKDNVTAKLDEDQIGGKDKAILDELGGKDD